MTVETKIAKNTIVQVVGRGIAICFALITLSVMTRYLGTQGYGMYTTVIAFLSVFSIIADLGLQMTSVQSISEKGVDETKVFSNIITLRFFASLIALILAPIIVIFFPYETAIKLGIIITAFAFFITAFTTILTGVFQKHLMMAKVALGDIVNKIVILILTLASVIFGWGLFGILSALIFGNLFQFLILFYYSQKIIKFSWQIDLSLYKKLLKKTLPLAAAISLNLLYFKGDTVILSVIRTQTEVGLYGAPYRILEVLINLVFVFLGLLFPLMTLYYTSKNWNKLKKILQLSFDVIFIVSLPLIFGVLFLGPNLMSFIAGNEFLVSGQILKILIFATVIIFFAAPLGYLIVAANQQKKIIKYYLANAVLSLIAYFIFIPLYGFWAAAIITVFSEFFILVSAYIVARKVFKFMPNFIMAKKAVLASIIMCLALYLVQDFHILLSLTIASIVYLFTLYLLKGFSKELIMDIINMKK